MGGIWVGMEISPSCFPLSLPSLLPSDRLLRALQVALSGAPLTTARTGLSCQSLPRGQWVCSGRACCSEWASLQFHYSGNWLEWKLYLTSRRAPATTWKLEGRKGETESEANVDGKWERSFSGITSGEVSSAVNEDIYICNPSPAHVYHINNINNLFIQDLQNTEFQSASQFK